MKNSFVLKINVDILSIITIFWLVAGQTNSFPGLSKAIPLGFSTGTTYLSKLECTFILQMSL